MTFDEFVKKYKGKAIDYDGVAGVQCVDLIKLYLRDCFGIKAGAWGDAKDYYEEFPQNQTMMKAFRRIPNSADFIPMAGDIVIYGAKYSKSHSHGHIGIASDECTINRVKMWDFNATGKHDAMALNSYGYTTKDIKGVLRPRQKEVYRVTAERLNVRYVPNGKILDVYKKGKIVWVLEFKGGWAKIGDNLWVCEEFIEKVPQI